MKSILFKQMQTCHTQFYALHQTHVKYIYVANLNMIKMSTLGHYEK